MADGISMFVPPIVVPRFSGFGDAYSGELMADGISMFVPPIPESIVPVPASLLDQPCLLASCIAGDGVIPAVVPPVSTVPMLEVVPRFSGFGDASSGELSDESRFKWKEVSKPSTWKADQLKADQSAAIAGWGPMDTRVFGTNILRAQSDSDQDIGQFRVVSYSQGKIDSKKQIFPKVTTSTPTSYKSMIIASQSQSYAERNQIIKSNKALHAYFFNDAPEVIQLQGFLKTTRTDPWDMAMLLLWDRLLRGTELARHNAILEFSIADMTYWGYPLNFAYQMSAQSQFVASFSMQVLIIDKLIPLNNMSDDIKGIITVDESLLGEATTNTMVEHDATQAAREAPNFGPNPAGNPFSDATIAQNAQVGASLPSSLTPLPANPASAQNSIYSAAMRNSLPASLSTPTPPHWSPPRPPSPPSV